MPTTKENLETAFAGESQANRKYLAFARQAEKDGLANVARLFKATAEAETLHATGHLKALDAIKSTAENLQAAIDGETYEFTEMYPPMLEQAEAEGLDRVFTAAGFEWREPGCSMCLAMNADRLEPGERCASTSNRNFEGRQGKGGRELIVGIVLGHEFEMRLCEAAFPGIRERGWHHGTLTAFAAPIVAGRMLDLPWDKIQHAIGISASHSGTLGAVTAGKLTMMRNTVDPLATQAGVMAALIAEKGYPSRSEAFRDLIRNALVEADWAKPAGEQAATLTLVYDHHTRELADRLTDMQTRAPDVIICTTHIHLTAHTCLEMIALRGAAPEIRAVADRLIATRGVQHGKLTMTTLGKS